MNINKHVYMNKAGEGGEGGGGDGGDAGGDGGKQPTVEELQSELERARAVNKEIKESRDATKAKLRQMEKEREDAATLALQEQQQYKSLYEKEAEARKRLDTRLRKTAVQGALRQELSKQGVSAVDTALKLVEWDKVVVGDDGEPNADSVLLSIEGLKQTDPVLFGKKGAITPNRPLDNGDGGGAKTMTRAAFDALPLNKRSEFMRSGGSLTE